MKRTKFSLLAMAFLFATTVFYQSCTKTAKVTESSPTATTYTENGGTVTVKDHGEGTGNKTFTADKVWVLDGFVFVNQGSTLTIEAGTVIKGNPGEGEAASALIVARGAKIIAEGTATKPIIFTAVSDDLNGSVSVKDRGLWGGLIVLGSGKLNTIPNILNIEGIPTTEPRGQYGGDNDADNSGILKYISIRHSGTNIGANNEINGLTLGGVGSETTIDYIEMIASNDDGIEFFGGKPNTKHLVSAYCKDDCFDYDQGYRGNGQFWLAVQDPATGDRLGEFDGADDPEDGKPFGIPQIFNATFIGSGLPGKRAITFRANAGGKMYNSIIINQEKGVDIQLKQDLVSESSYKRLAVGDLKVENNIFYSIADNTKAGVFKLNFDSGVSAADLQTAGDFLSSYVTGAKNTFDIDPGVTTPKSVSWSPIPTGNVTSDLATYPATFFTPVNYKGAFEPGAANWAKGWTLLFQ